MDGQRIMINEKLFITTGNNISGISLAVGGLSTPIPLGSFDTLVNLELLQLSYNIGSLPAGIFDKLTTLKTLIFFGNDFSSLPGGIFDSLVNLKELIIKNCNLTSLPEGIFDKLVNLERIELSDTNLSSLSDNIFDKLTKLKYICLADNKLDSLPLSIINCKELEKFYMRCTVFKYIRPQLQQFLKSHLQIELIKVCIVGGHGGFFFFD